jgi:hypothetical protein
MPLQYLQSIPGWMLARFLFGAAMAPCSCWEKAGSTPWPATMRVAASSRFTPPALPPARCWALADRLAGPLAGSGFSPVWRAVLLVPGIMLARPEARDGGHPEHMQSAADDKASDTGWLGIVQTAPAILLGTAFLPLSIP